jgi:hypothetical protein
MDRQANGGATAGLPDLDTSIVNIVQAEIPVRSKVNWHNNIYDGVGAAVAAYERKEAKEEGTGNNPDLQKALYFGVYNSIMGLLHVVREGAEGLDQFRRDIPKYRDTIQERLEYVDALFVAATVSTKGLMAVDTDADETATPERVGFSNKDFAKWKQARDLVAKACGCYAQKGVSRTGPKVQGRLDEAFGLLSPLRQKAFETYDGGIPEE